MNKKNLKPKINKTYYRAEKNGLAWEIFKADCVDGKIIEERVVFSDVLSIFAGKIAHIMTGGK